MNNVEKFIARLEKIKKIVFKKHFYERAEERPISEYLVKEQIKKTQNILNVEEQKSLKKEKKFKIWIKLSNKYSLVLIVSISKKTLYIITGWNTNRKWQKEIQK
jgi:hypothetical protein